MVEYDIAQICLNGHVVNDAIERRPENNQNFCRRCGQRTITECPRCNVPIQGHPYYDTGVNLAMYIDAPKHCIECGNRFPWFEDQVQAAKELAEMQEDLDDKDKELLKKSFDDLIQYNAKSEVAALKIRRVFEKLKLGQDHPLYKAAINLATGVSGGILVKILTGGMGS
jgi:hypothetical protein